MSETATLYGFDGSTYVRTVRMVLADKGIAHDNVQVNVLTGEPRKPEHLQRHPFGKIPVLDIDGLRIRETDAICRYLDETRPAPGLVPDDPALRARMNEAISLINAYGYDALIGVAGYHLFPQIVGGRNDEVLEQRRSESQTLLELLIRNQVDGPWLAGTSASLADYFLGPLLYYVSLTSEKQLLALPGVDALWERIQQLDNFAATAPKLG